LPGAEMRERTARRQALVRRVERERAHFGRALSGLGPIVRTIDRAVVVGVALRRQPLLAVLAAIAAAAASRLPPARWLRRAGIWSLIGRLLVR
jgi:hypothetical protein